MTIIRDDGPIFEASAKGDTVEIISRSEAEALYQHNKDKPDDKRDWFAVEVQAGRFRIGHNDGAPRYGKVVRSNQPGKLQPFGSPMTAYVDELPTQGNAEIEVRRVGFDWVPDPVSEIFSASQERDSDVPVASDGYTNTKQSEDVAANGDLVLSVEPPSRAEQTSIRVEGAASFDVTLAHGNTSITFNSDAQDVIDEVLPVYYLDDGINVTVTDTSGAANNEVKLDMAVV